MAGVLITCKVCKNKIPMNNMRYDDNGEDLICNDCYNKKHGKVSISKPADAVEKRGIQNKPTDFKAKLDIDFEKKPTEERVTFACEKCKFKFSRKPDFPVTQCPYCGSTYIKQQ